MLDNHFLKRKQNLVWVCIVVVYTIASVLKTVSVKMAASISDTIKSKVLHVYKEKRDLKRIEIQKARVYIGTKVHGKELFTDHAELIDVNEEAFLIYADHRISQDKTYFKLETGKKRRSKRGSGKKIKSAICYGEIYREFEITNTRHKYSYVIKYTPISPFHAYMIDQYFLKKSII